MFGRGPEVAAYEPMTRSYNFQKLARRVPRVEPRLRDPSIAALSFTCYRLVAIDDPAPGEPPFESVELVFPPNVMSALVRPRVAATRG